MDQEARASSQAVFQWDSDKGWRSSTVTGENKLLRSATSADTNDAPASAPLKPVRFCQLLRYASACDLLLWLLGVVAASGAGAMMPIFIWYFGEIMVSGFGVDIGEIQQFAYTFLILGAIQGGFGAFQQGFLSKSAAHQGASMKRAYLNSILRQEVAWFDVKNTLEITSSLERDTVNVIDALGTKSGMFFMNLTQFVGGIGMAFAKGWQLTLVCLAVLPFMGVSAAFMMKSMSSMASQSEKAYAGAGGTAEEAIGSIRTVASISGQEREYIRYTAELARVLRLGGRKACSNGAGMGVVLFFMFGAYSIGMYYGTHLVVAEEFNKLTGTTFNGGDVMSVFWAVIIASFGVGQLGPALTSFAKAQISAARMYAVIERQSLIDPADQKGLKPESVSGSLELRNVSFTYPSRPDAPIFQGLDLCIEAGRTVALVGSSGSGKSTVVQLVERFYDPLEGQVLLDGMDLRELNVKWLRSKIGLVGQEPVLFNVSIKENIRYGKPDASDEEVVEAAKASNAHGFISTFPDGYDTQVGHRGTQMSGGQKQRIAIARAIIANPQILLLDEATSALDTESEAVVQAALDNLMVNRTTIVVAHRLSTIRKANTIVVFNKGTIVEQGTHDELLQNGGHYAALVNAQLAGQEAERRASESRRGSISLQRKLSERTSLQMATAPTADTTTDTTTTALETSAQTTVTIHGDTDVKDAPTKEEEVKEVVPAVKGAFCRAMKLNSPEWPFLVVGLLASLCSGAAFPIMAVLLTDVLANFFSCIDRGDGVFVTFFKTLRECEAVHSSGCTTSLTGGFLFTHASKQACFDVMVDQAALFCTYFAILALGAGLSNFFQIFCFTVMGENLTKRLREQAFASILKQEIGWFDLKENAVGRLTGLLSTEITLVEGAVGTTLGLTLQNILLFAVSLFIAFYNGWELTLICLAVVPIMLVGSMLQMKYQFIGSSDGGNFNNSSGVSSEAVGSVRTVASLCAESRVCQRYEAALADDQGSLNRTAGIGGLGAGFALFTQFSFNFVGFMAGAFLMRKGRYSFEDVLQVFFSIQFMAMGAGQAAALAPDVGAAKPAMNKVFALIDRESAIDPTSKEGKTPEKVQGHLQFRSVSFKYPSRPTTDIFLDLNLTIEPGKTVALVGGSGSGKSTIVQLIERFYDPQGGVVLLDGQDLRELNVAWLRRNIGLVGQEPVLFSATIAENIRYGKPSASEAEVEAAAKAANAHQFIVGLPKGYDTMVGIQGSQLSGGQKQRIAIARAIIGNPPILLLDEATSALDAESEKLVQGALENLMQNRTTIVVAHRLSTIRNANSIVVFQKGVLLEQGTHEELSKNPDSAYSMLVKNQMQAGH